MRRGFFLSACLLLFPGGSSAFSGMSEFYLDYHAYLVNFSSRFHQYDFDDKWRVDRLPEKVLETRMAVDAAFRIKSRWIHLGLKSDLRSRLVRTEEDRDWEWGAGDVEVFACRPFGSRLLAGGLALFPTASYRRNLGDGCRQYSVFFAARYGLSMTAEGSFRYFEKNPDGTRPGPLFSGGVGWEDMFTADLFLNCQMKDDVPEGGTADRATFTLRVQLGLLDDQFGNAMSFIHVFTDVLGRDAPLLSGISIGAAF